MAVIKEVTSVASILMPIGENWTVSRCRYRSEDGADGRLCIATGIHGDERMGQLIVYDVAQRIQREPQHLHGIVDIYPMLNPLGLDLCERTVPSGNRLDMNRAFPGSPDGTALESICYRITQDMKGADLVLDIHSSSQVTSELYAVRLHEQMADAMIPGAAALCPELMWVVPDRAAYNATLAGALTQEGVCAAVLMVDERRLNAQRVANQAVEGIFCKMKEMGLWTGETVRAPEAGQIPCMRERTDACRITCTRPGMYVPVERIGTHVNEGDVLGTIIDALRGEPVETVTASESGLVFSQRRYSAVYPGTLIARLCRKERA